MPNLLGYTMNVAMWAGLALSVSILLTGAIVCFLLKDDNRALLMLPIFYGAICFFSIIVGLVRVTRVSSLLVRNRLTYGQSLYVSFFTLFFAGIILTAGAYLFFKLWPDFFSQWLHSYLSLLDDVQKQNPDTLSQVTGLRESLKSMGGQLEGLSPIQAAMQFFWMPYSFYSTFIVLVTSLFLRGNYKKNS